jgi:hypothetical protein
MKRFLVACSLALAVVSMADQKAMAWKKFNFNIGMNISSEAAENNFLWGAFRNGPHPFAQGGHGGGYGAGGYGPGGYGPGGYGGADPLQYYNPLPQGGAPNNLPFPQQSTPAQNSPSGQQGTGAAQGTQRVGYSYYNSYPYNSTGYYQVPSYWYGN